MPDATLAALGDPTRRRVVELLGHGPRRAGDLAAALEASAPAMSRHLRVLRQSGLVEVQAQAPTHDARVRLYRLRREPLRELREWVTDLEAFWTAELEAFKAHVEGSGS